MNREDFDCMIDEIIRLQERVRALEREQLYPDNAFWGQLLFDVFAVIGFVWVVIMLSGR